MNTKLFGLFLSAAVAAVILVGCSGNTGRGLTVDITDPISTITSGGAAVTLNATVTKDGSTPGVGWTLVTTGTSTACAPTCGALSGATTTSVVYTPPVTTPSPATISVVATSLSKSTIVATDSFTITGPVVEAACQVSPAARGNEAAMTQPIAFLVKGEDSEAEPIAYAGSFTPNGAGAITSADLDVVSVDEGTGEQVVQAPSSSYSYGADGRGCLFLSFTQETDAKHPMKASKTAGQASHFHPTTNILPKKFKGHTGGPKQSSDLNSVVLSFAILDLNGAGRIMEFDNTDGAVTITAGQMHVQTPAAFTLNSLASNFAFGLDGWLVSEGVWRTGIAGSFTTSAGELSNGFADEVVGGEITGEQSGGSGVVNGEISNVTGRGTGTYSTTEGEFNIPFDFAYYVINGSDIYIISTDDPSEGGFMLSGRALQSTATSSALNGYYISGLIGLNCEDCDSISPDAGNNYVSIATLNATSALAATGTSYTSNGGPSANTPFSGSYALDTVAGRVGFSNALENAVGYLTAPESDEGIVAFLVGTDENSAGGFLVFQSSSQPNYTDSALSGNYTFASVEDVAGNEGSIAGVFNFSGGQYSAIADSSSVGGAQVPGQTFSDTYTVNADGSGAIDPSDEDPVELVTNGTLVIAIDTNVDQPQLYVWTQQPDDEGSKKKAKTNATTTAHK